MPALAVVQTPGPEYRTLVEQCLCVYRFGFDKGGGCLCYSKTVRADDHLHIICWISTFFKGNSEVLSDSAVIGDASICFFIDLSPDHAECRGMGYPG